MEKMLVTGSEGFFASRFIEYYKNNYEFILLNRKNFDITNEKEVIELFKRENIDFVLHTAAIADTQKCEKFPNLAEKINVDATINIAKGCALKNSTLIFTSSEQIFNGNIEDGPYSEDTMPTPNTVYGYNKLKGEDEIIKLLDKYYNLRLTWMFSFPERNKKINHNIIYNTLNALINNSTMKMPDGEFRGMTYVYEVIKNFNKILEIPYGTYNTGSENELSTYDTALKVLKHMNLENRAGEIIIRDSERFKEKNRDLRISNKRLRDYGIKFLNTEEGIKRCIEEFNN